MFQLNYIVLSFIYLNYVTNINYFIVHFQLTLWMITLFDVVFVEYVMYG